MTVSSVERRLTNAVSCASPGRDLVVRPRNRMQRIDERQFPDAGSQQCVDRVSDDAHRSGCASRPSGNADGAPAVRRDGATPTRRWDRNASGGARVAFEHLDLEAVCLHRERTGEPGDTGADDDDFRHEISAGRESICPDARRCPRRGRALPRRSQSLRDSRNCSAETVGRPRAGRWSCTAGRGSSGRSR